MPLLHRLPRCFASRRYCILHLYSGPPFRPCPGSDGSGLGDGTRCPGSRFLCYLRGDVYSTVILSLWRLISVWLNSISKRDRPEHSFDPVSKSTVASTQSTRNKQTQKILGFIFSGISQANDRFFLIVQKLSGNDSLLHL